MKGALRFWLLLFLVPTSLRAQSFCSVVTADPLVSPIVLGNGTPGSVTTAQIQTALATGGHIRSTSGPARPRSRSAPRWSSTSRSCSTAPVS